MKLKDVLKLVESKSLGELVGQKRRRKLNKLLERVGKM